jgi:S1-C subfamily serine protease
VTTIDWIIVAACVLMAAVGYGQGFVVGVLSIAGFVGGALLGTRLGPAIFSEGSSSPYAPLFGLVGALFGGLILSTGLSGVGGALRDRLARVAPPGVGAIDGLLGAVLSVALALGIAWVVGSVALQTPGARRLRRDVQRSEILQRLNAVLPPSGPLLHSLARFDPFPQIEGPQADVDAPRAAIARDPGVKQAAASVVRVLGTACGLGVSGSGWVAGDRLVVTNAHVVAGQDDTTVQLRGTGERLDAHALSFSARDDLAVLGVDGLRAPALRLERDPAPGTAAAILGFPLNGPYDVRAGRVGRTGGVLSQDALGRGPVRRSVTPFRGTVRPGNSGGPMVDGRGRVVTTVFAATRGTGRRGGYGVPNAAVVRALARARRGERVSTGPCAQ